MGEFELLARMRERLPESGPRVHLGSGDDAAITVPGGATATSVDAIVDGVHFRRAQTSPQAVGRKALAAALSDLAAMGAGPGEAYVAVGAAPDLGEDELLEIVAGMAELAAETGTTLAGGDLTRAPALSLTVTVVGHARRPEALVRRAGASAGDLVTVTGELGGAAAGLLLLERPELAAALPEEAGALLRGRQLEPRPRLRSGQALAGSGASAMIDLSDGLGADAGHLAGASGVALRIDASKIPIAEGVTTVAVAAGEDPLSLSVGGGEDYELLATLPRERLPEASNRVEAAGETTLTPIGEVVAGTGVEIRRPGGGTVPTTGFDHLRS
jgi:thiamine-monophosphate kinase